MKSMTTTLLVFICSSLFSITAYAELSPMTYLDMQQRAPEQLIIQVIDVAQKGEDVTATAKVVSVKKSATKLQAGQDITIRYQHTPLQNGMTGTSAIPILGRYLRYQAFLENIAAETYQPFAGNQSFTDDVFVITPDLYTPKKTNPPEN